MVAAVIASLAVTTAANVAIAQADRAAILDAARVPVAKQLGKPVKFKVQTLKRDGDWVFLAAAMQDAGGKPLSYVGTPLASAEAEGMVSKDYYALLRREGPRWRVVDYAVGPTDVAWADWSTKYGAPAALFGF